MTKEELDTVPVLTWNVADGELKDYRWYDNDPGETYWRVVFDTDRGTAVTYAYDNE